MASMNPFRFLKFFLTDKREPWPQWIESAYAEKPVERVGAEKIRYTFINHATVLIQTASLNILTDPIWSYRCSPFSWIGPRRYRNPGVRFEDLPRIDLILISHNHYDHMDLPTLRRLTNAFGSKILVGSGNQEYLERKRIRNVSEFDWWGEYNQEAGVRVTFVPAKHFSGRGFFDRNKTLWGGFVIETPAGSIFFAGDTGYHSHFDMIYKMFGPVDLSFLPIGAYKPRNFMCAVHMDPVEAVRAHQDLKSRQSVGIHFGTFRLSFEGIDEPEADLVQARLQAGLSPESFQVPAFGSRSEVELVVAASVATLP